MGGGRNLKGAESKGDVSDSTPPESTGIQLVHYRSELSSDPVSDERDLEVIFCRLDLFV